MKKLLKSKSLIISLVIALVLTVAVFAVSALAADETSDTPVLTIETNNLSYADSIYMLYAVSNEGFDKDKNEIKMLFWNDVQDEYLLGTEDYVSTSRGAITYNGKRCEVFYSEGIPARKMTVEIYSRAYVEIDGVVHYSEVKKFSILEYAYLLREKGANPDLIAMADAMLEYGAAAQKVLNSNLDKLANATYYRINVAGGTLADGFTSGLFIENGTVTVKAEKTFLNYVFKGWENSKGEVVSTNPEDTFNVVANETYSAKYEEVPSYTEGLEFTLSDDETYYSVTGYTGTDTEVVIPETYEGLPVREINEYAFKQNKIITSINIPNTVTNLQSSAFYNCSALQYANLGNGITSIERTTFSNCSSLISVVIPDTVTSLGADAFHGCTSLKELHIGEKVNSIGTSALYNCINLERITVSENNTAYMSIDGNLYSKDGKLLIQYAAAKKDSSFIIPATVETICDYAFFRAESLSSVTIGNSVKTIGKYAFRECIRLSDLTIGNCVQTIEQGAFYLCSSLKDVTIGESVTNIGNYAFSKSGITNLTISNSVKSIGSEAFYGCAKLTTVTLGSGIQSISASAFNYCANITTVSYVGTESDWSNVTIAAGNDSILNANIIFLIKEYTDGLVFTLSEDETYYSVTGYEGTDTRVMIPATYEGLPVKSIGELAFKEKNITSVVIADGVETICNRAFILCNKLESIKFYPSITNIEAQAFDSCKALDRVYIYDLAAWCNLSLYNTNSPLCYGADLYLNDELLVDLMIPEGITDFKYMFQNCTSITNVTIGNDVSIIREKAFLNCKNIKNVTICNNVESIGKAAFNGCSSLESMTLPFVGRSINETYDTEFSIIGYIFGDTQYEGAEYIQQTYHNGWAIGCYMPSSLNSITVTGGDIKRNAFYKCTTLKTVTIEGNVNTIEAYAFLRCTNLTDVIINGNVKKISGSVFQGCTSLTNVTLPNTIESIDSWNFKDCPNFTNVYISDLAAWCNITFRGDESNPLCYAENLYLNGELVTNLVIPDNITTIGQYAFHNYKKLTSVTIGNSVTSIGESAFSGCTGLKSVTIGEGVTSISSAFKDCTSLERVYFNAIAMNDLSRRNYLFYNAGLSGDGIEVVIGSKVTRIPAYLFYPYDDKAYSPKVISLDFENGSVCESIGDYAFYQCDKLAIVNIPENITSIGYLAFSGCYSLIEVINESSLDLVEGATTYGYVTYFAKEIHTGESKVVKYGDYLFYTYDDVNYLFCYLGDDNDLILPDSYNGESYEIYKYAFCTLGNLTSIDIPNSVTGIGDYAFEYCTGLTNIVIPDSVTYIGSSAFYQCTGLEALTIGNGVISIGKSAFYGCTGLVDIDIPYGVETIGQAAFSNCSALKSVSLPNSVQSIGKAAFSYCSALSKIIIPDSVHTIEESAFNQCQTLTTVTIGSGVKIIGNKAFDYCYKLIEVINNSTLKITAGSWDYGYIATYAKEVHTGESKIVNADGYLFYSYDGINYLVGYAGNSNELVLPDYYNSEEYEIYRCAFAYCRNITNVTIGEGVTSIGSKAFYSCTNINDITFKNPNGWWYAFSATATSGTDVPAETLSNPATAAKYLKSSYTEAYWHREDGLIFTLSSDKAYYSVTGYTGTDAEVIIPAEYAGLPVKEIGSSAFKNCTAITSVTIPGSITTIGEDAFAGCTEITNAVFENPNGWFYSTSATATSGTDVPAENLANTATAATYLKSTYSNYYWHRADVVLE